MSRPTVRDLAKKAGVSPSTVDRVLNSRIAVRSETAQQVLEAAEAIGFHGVNAIRQRLRVGLPVRRLGFLLQPDSHPFHRALGKALTDSAELAQTMSCHASLCFADDFDPTAVARRLEELGSGCDALAIASADHPLIAQAIERLRGRGIPVFAIISDLSAEGLSGYVGLDNRKVGRTAAWFIAQGTQATGKVAISVGTHRHLCQETCEMSFRSYLREHAPDCEMLEPFVTFERDDCAYEETLNLLKHNPDLKAIYIAGGGIAGVLRALRETVSPNQVRTISLEWNPCTQAALHDGYISTILAHPIPLLARRLLDIMETASSDSLRGNGRINIVVPFEIYTPENT